MFGLGNTYDEEYLDLYDYMINNGFKQLYAKEFLTTYKKSIGKMYADGKKRTEKWMQSKNPNEFLMGTASIGQQEAFALTAQAYKGYMTDLRGGKFVGTPVELSIWAILAMNTALLKDTDPMFANFVNEKVDKLFPNLGNEVFGIDSEV